MIEKKNDNMLTALDKLMIFLKFVFIKKKTMRNLFLFSPLKCSQTNCLNFTQNIIIDFLIIIYFIFSVRRIFIIYFFKMNNYLKYYHINSYDLIFIFKLTFNFVYGSFKYYGFRIIFFPPIKLYNRHIFYLFILFLFLRSCAI